MKKLASIVIPIYKICPDESELTSLKQSIKVLSAYDFIIVCPESLDAKYYEELFIANNINYTIQRFDNKYFEGILGYNRLLLSFDFYSRFTDYEYMLIYQLDAYVFNDDLEYWCNLGYDYIGAPWVIFDPTQKTLKGRIKYRTEQKINSLLNKPNSWLLNGLRVGNGGFSLRKISKFRKIILKYENSDRLAKYYTPQSIHYNEDIFWSCEVNRYYPYLRIPSYKKALYFAFELQPEICFRLTKHTLPFGCHGFSRFHVGFWRKHLD